MDLKDAVMTLHDIARKVNAELHDAKLVEELRTIADKINELIKTK